MIQVIEILFRYNKLTSENPGLGYRCLETLALEVINRAGIHAIGLVVRIKFVIIIIIIINTMTLTTQPLPLYLIYNNTILSLRFL
jgi:hypothetical protein